MLKECRVLVTGAGSGVGQGIIKSLRKSDLPIKIIGSDISKMNAGLYRTDESILLPKVEDEGALDLIIQKLNCLKINLVLIGSEFDVIFFSVNKSIIESSTDAKVCVAPIETIKIADDKWLTALFLEENKLPFSPAFLPSSISDAIRQSTSWEYPVILKSRSGTSSRHVHVINSNEELKEKFHSVPSPMLQKVIDLPSAELKTEYTCSVFKTCSGSLIGPFTARRTVKGGTSWHIEVNQFEELTDALISIGKSLDFIGSLNIQLMLSENGPVPFELNARFSGTTAIRAYFGFNEPEMAVKNIFYNQEIEIPKLNKGIVLRYNEEVFIDDVGYEDLDPLRHKGLVIPWF